MKKKMKKKVKKKAINKLGFIISTKYNIEGNLQKYSSIFVYFNLKIVIRVFFTTFLIIESL